MAKRAPKKSKSSTTVDATPVSRKLRFHYLKGPAFRTVHADGVHGGLTPQGKIQIAVFSERFPIPKETVHEFAPPNKLKELSAERVTRDGAIREIEVSLIMDPKTAASLVEWLSKRLDEYKTIVEQQKGLT